MSTLQVTIWMYVVGLLPTTGFLADTKCIPLVRIPVILFWPISIPAATIPGLVLRALETRSGS